MRPDLRIRLNARLCICSRLGVFAIAGAIYGSLRIEFQDLRPLSLKLLPILFISWDRDLSKIVAVDAKSNNSSRRRHANRADAGLR